MMAISKFSFKIFFGYLQFMALRKSKESIKVLSGSSSGGGGGSGGGVYPGGHLHWVFV